MPQHGQHVKVKLVCKRCQHGMDLCVLVHRNVPQPIACSPGAPISGGGGGVMPYTLSCPSCGLSWRMSVAEMQDRVDDVTRRGWGQHMREGAVVLYCPAA